MLPSLVDYLLFNAPGRLLRRYRRSRLAPVVLEVIFEDFASAAAYARRARPAILRRSDPWSRFFVVIVPLRSQFAPALLLPSLNTTFRPLQ